jgi:hypothetical protein
MAPLKVGWHQKTGHQRMLWVECVTHFHKWFRSSVGRPKAMATNAETKGHKRAISSNASRKVFA